MQKPYLLTCLDNLYVVTIGEINSQLGQHAFPIFRDATKLCKKIFQPRKFNYLTSIFRCILLGHVTLKNYTEYILSRKEKFPFFVINIISKALDLTKFLEYLKALKGFLENNLELL